MTITHKEPLLVLRFVRIIATLFSFLAPLLSGLYIAQAIIMPYVPLPLFLEIKAALPLILILCWLICIPSLFLLKIRRVYKIIAGLLMILIVCITGVFMLGTAYLLSSVQVDNNHYHLIVAHQEGDIFRTCLLYQCNTSDLECVEIGSYYSDCHSMIKSDLVVNPNTNEINVFKQMYIGLSEEIIWDYTYGTQPRSYLDKLEVEGYDYYLAYYYEYHSPVPHSTFKYMLYKCLKGDLTCERLSFQYDTAGLPASSLELDSKSGDIRVLIDYQLIYTYGSSPQCYVDGCQVMAQPREKYRVLDFDKEQWVAQWTTIHGSGDWLKDPETMALRMAGYPNEYGSPPEKIDSVRSQDDKVIITILSLNLRDDSIKDQEVRVDLRKVGEIWDIDWAGSRWRCRRGDFQDDWTASLCP